MSNFKKLSLIQFRNYRQATYWFDQRIVAVTGPNGSGKTNLLDALYYLCFTRSYFARPDNKNVLHGTDGFRLEVTASALSGGTSSTDRQGTDQICCIVRIGGKKEILFNQVPYNKFSEHVGRLPAVMIAPDDSTIITGGSEERRKFVDQVLSQTDREYLVHLIQYNKILQQRNALLKSGAAAEQQDDVLNILDQQLSREAAPIYQKRKLFFDAFIPAVIMEYANIAGSHEGLLMQYDSQLARHPLETLLLESRQTDLVLQRTTKGVHRDDLSVFLDTLPFKGLASQGQRKSLLFALKLAAYHYIAEQRQVAPVLLLDDVFEKLDQKRMLNLLEQVTTKLKGQVFITDTHAERLQMAFSELGHSFQLITLDRISD